MLRHARLILPAVWLLACNGKDTGPTGPATIALSTNLLEFGSVPLDTTAELPVTVSNDGSQSLEIRSVSLVDGDDDVWSTRREPNVSELAGGESLILLGDLNDGPGLDEYEHLFGRSSVEIVMGGEPPRLYDPHAEEALRARLTAPPSSARFYIKPERRYLQALLDYVMISPDLMAANPRWRIWHPFDDPECWGRAELRDALIAASDHFPVVLDIDL